MMTIEQARNTSAPQPLLNERYAVYFAPAKLSPWWQFGAHWLGRDDWENTALPQPKTEGICTDEFARITAQPRRYGFHATLKAPFRLADGHTQTTLLSRLHLLASQLAPVPLGRMHAVTLAGFVALSPNGDVAGLQQLAAQCVQQLDDLRAPPSPKDLLRRQAHQLDEREAELLGLYGYPYVMERFRLHFTLTSALAAADARRIEQVASKKIEPLNRDFPLTLDRLCLFAEHTADAPLVRIADILLHGSAR